MNEVHSITLNPRWLAMQFCGLPLDHEPVSDLVVTHAKRTRQYTLTDHTDDCEDQMDHAGDATGRDDHLSDHEDE